MDNLLLVQMQPEIARSIRAGLTGTCVEEVTREDAINSMLELRAGDLGALVLGTHSEAPLQLVEHASKADPDLAVLILCDHARYKRVARDLRFSRVVGLDVRCVVPSPHEPFVDLVRKALIRTRKRRRHRALLDGVQADTRGIGPVSTGVLNRLQESEERFRAIFEQAAVGVAQIDTNTGRFVTINQRYCDLAGLNPEDVNATTFMDITHPDDLQADLDEMERLKAGEIHEFSMEKRYIRPDGEIVWVNLTVSPMWEVGREPTHHIAVVEDITDRKRAEDALRATEERFRLAMEAVTDPIVTIDVDGRILFANEAIENVFGHRVSELVGEPVTTLVAESMRAAYTAGFNRYAQRGKRSTSWKGVFLTGRHKNGKEISLEVSFGEFVSNGTRAFTGIIHDISERKREEERLLMEKETLEKFADLTVQIDSGLTLEEILDRMFDAFAAVVPYDRVGCALVEDHGQTARSVWVRSTSPAVHIPVGYSAHLEGSSLQAIIESGQPRILNDLEAHLREHPGSESTRRILAEGMRSSLTCPLIAMGKPVGLLFFSSTKAHTYEDVHVDLYLRIAEHLSLIIEKGHLFQKLLEAKREVEVRNRLISEVFGRYTSDAVVSQLLDSPEELRTSGETRKVTLMFADLRGFTSMCASLDPQRVVRLLNIYLGQMADVIMDHRGTIDELLGDGIFVLFGAPLLAADDARRALECALAMHRAMGEVNRKLSEEGLPALEMGIAVHTGEVVAGSIGSLKRAKYGVVGPAVILTSRMEAFATGGQILCSEATLQEVGDIVDFDERVEIRPKGMSEPVQVYSVRGLRDQPGSPPA